MEGFAGYADVAREALDDVVGIRVLYRPQDREPFYLTVLWSDPHEVVLDTDDGVAVSTTDPVAHVRWANLKQGVELHKDDCLEKGDETYLVSEVKPDGQTGSRLILRLPDPE